MPCSITGTGKPVLNGHSKLDKTKIFMTNGILMKVESIAECSPCSITGTGKPVLNGHSKLDKTKIFMTNGILMKVKSIAECSP